MGATQRRELSTQSYRQLDQYLAAVDRRFLARYPGESQRRQPLHTVYIPADRFRADLTMSWGAAALGMLEELLPGGSELAEIVDVSGEVADEVLRRVRTKLTEEPIEDLRIDFEDGFGLRSDAEEDATVVDAARELLAACASEQAPTSFGLRIKGLEPASRHRGIHTLDAFLGELTCGRNLPAGFTITLPKVTAVEQIEAFVEVCAALESVHCIPPGLLRFEIQIETPQAVLSADGTAAVARMVHAGAGRVSGLHYGTYDYSAACGIAPAWQSADHPAADHAKAVLQLAAAGTGVHVADGSTNVLPVGSPNAVRDAWRLHARLVSRALERGFYQGWDLHPGHLISRYAATFAFYRAGWTVAADRLRRYVDHRESGVLDEPATAQALAAYLLRGRGSGALDIAEVIERAGVGEADLVALSGRRVG